MVLYCLLTAELCLTLANYYISRRNIMNPATVFCIMNLLSTLVCFYARQLYSIEFHWNTFFVLLTGLLIFTAANILVKGKFRFSTGKRRRDNANQLFVVPIHYLWILLFAAFSLVVLYFKISYIRRVSRAYGVSGSLPVQIGIYNTLRKFNFDKFLNLRVGESKISAWGYPLCLAFSYFSIVVNINNRYAGKRNPWYYWLPIGITAVTSLIMGSRGQTFRTITAIVYVILIYRKRIGEYEGRVKLGVFARALFLATFIVLGFSFVVPLLGRTTQGGFKTFFTYIGAPLFNLDSFLQEGIQHSTTWGRETFGYLYGFLGGIFNKPEWVYSLTLPFKYVNGVSTGNVYTMYYQFILDFGYAAIVPLTIIPAFYYCRNYKLLVRKNSRYPLFSFRLIYFSRLANALIMLVFSNRFYEDLFLTTYIRMDIFLIIIWMAYKHGVFSMEWK